jgi:hypothetical protein
MVTSNNVTSRIRTGLASFGGVLAVMLVAAIAAKRLRWSSFQKRLISAT